MEANNLSYSQQKRILAGIALMNIAVGDVGDLSTAVRLHADMRRITFDPRSRNYIGMLSCIVRRQNHGENAWTRQERLEFLDLLKSDMIEAKVKLLLQMSLVLVWGVSLYSLPV